MSRLQHFVAELLEREGALVDAIEPEGIEVMAPPSLQRALRIPDFCRLGFGAALPAGAERVGMEADWLDRLGTVIGDRGRWSRLVLTPENPPLNGVETLLEHELILANAPFRLIGVQPAWTRYLILDFRFAARSDEQRDGVLRLGVNLATCAMLDGMLDRLAPWLEDDGGDLPAEAELPPAWDRARVLAWAGTALRPRLERLLEPFVKSLHRRLGRDRDRLYGFHNEAYRELMRRMAALGEADAGHVREQQRVDSIAREYRARLDDLAHKYALHVTVEWIRTLELVMPVQRLEVLVRRRKGERVIRLDWNPLARCLEPPACEHAHAAERPRVVCDEALHLVSPPGLAPCAGCDKPYCRACHRERCPKCGRADAPAGLDLTRSA